ncbi:carboxymuconolactone decarboxylase family protein [Paraburkholderia azotifigens]|uniref:Carboxymuconolactone decarboxylase family protein n=1 Tax=Paraburkholderia azotifigens TaxID=2057004 RepID=A0A5C6VDF7_9BURK|nr:carboxymuconolactone decarboxylase family protein [Paraburkholderia azotifigens]TXC81088.1 carboxymuconolactone decarboxylase family protein [Paraburkholderia azotifigens]
MPRVTIPDRDDAPTESQEMLNAVARQLRFVPALFRATSISPDALTGMTQLSAAVSRAFDARTLARIALAVSQVNECKYCLSLHTYLGMNLGKLSPDEMLRNRWGDSTDTKSMALVMFVRKLVETRGNVVDSELKMIRGAGFGDAQIIEIVAASAYFIFTNLINNVFDTKIDFPEVDVDAKAA